jgi:hypothetical protein
MKTHSLKILFNELIKKEKYILLNLLFIIIINKDSYIHYGSS